MKIPSSLSKYTIGMCQQDMQYFSVIVHLRKHGNSCKMSPFTHYLMNNDANYHINKNFPVNYSQILFFKYLQQRNITFLISFNFAILSLASPEIIQIIPYQLYVYTSYIIKLNKLLNIKKNCKTQGCFKISYLHYIFHAQPW